MSEVTADLSSFMKRKGFVITNESDLGSEPSDRYGLARQVYKNKAILVPFLTEMALAIPESRLEYSSSDSTKANLLRNFLDGLKKMELIPGYDVEQLTFKVQLPQDELTRRYFRSEWAEHCFRHVISSVVVDYCNERDFRYALFSNVHIKKENERNEFTELDLVVQIEKRFYAFEVKSGPRVNILQWAAREKAFVDKKGDFKIIVCTIFDNIPAPIFEPQLLMTIGGIKRRFKKQLKEDFGPIPGVDLPRVPTIEEIARALKEKRCRNVCRTKNEIKSRFNKTNDSEVESIFQQVIELTGGHVDAVGHIDWGAGPLGRVE